MKKKVLAVVLIGVMAFSTACAGSEIDPVSQTQEMSQPAPEADADAQADVQEGEETASDAQAGDGAQADEAGSADANTGKPTEASDEALAAIAEDSAPSVDISGCDTFTQIVDKKLADGMGYANERIGDTDVLLVSSGTYDNLDGNMAAIDATIFAYGEDEILELGKVCCGGTAYPLAVKDGILYVGSNHWGVKYTVKDNQLIMLEKASVEYDSDGNETFFYESGEGVDKDATEAFDGFFSDLESATIINFQPVGGVVSLGSDESSQSSDAELPKYEYPGPELFYSVLYDYIISEFGQGYYMEDGAVTIPSPCIIAEDESNKEDIKVWGDFWVFNYKLNGDILENISGGSHPGCIHLKSTDAGYEVVSVDEVADGADYEPTAKKIFGKYYKDLVKSGEDQEGRKATRAQIIANYAAANNLNISAYQDYGWDPVTLPEENIDNFYSDL